jgi:hypothetical protein
MLFQSRSLATSVLGLHSSCFEQICHSIIVFRIHVYLLEPAAWRILIRHKVFANYIRILKLGLCKMQDLFKLLYLPINYSINCFRPYLIDVMDILYILSSPMLVYCRCLESGLNFHIYTLVRDYMWPTPYSRLLLEKPIIPQLDTN